ncbi:hypothetical protein bcere0016_55430 [Bacillus cereus 95/8201]|uniref:hypothetical protein n=1 Tax=Bacillus thuringiensis TaxID=1428 RepID=UPI0001A08E9E|nr:hypothetical protein bcere0016_55430 [Bacillus cereus 95/8201]
MLQNELELFIGNDSLQISIEQCMIDIVLICLVGRNIIYESTFHDCSEQDILCPFCIAINHIE